VAAQRLGNRVARLRHQIAIPQTIALALTKVPAPRAVGIAPQLKAERRVADGAGHDDPVAGLGARAPQHLSVRNGAEHRNGNRDWPGRSVGVTAEQRAAEGFRIRTEPARKRRQPIVADLFRQRQSEQETERPCSLGGKIRKVHAQCLLADRVGRIVGKKMHATDNAVGLEYEVAAGRRLDHRGIVAEPEGAGMFRERREVAPDQPLLAGLLLVYRWAHDCSHASC